MFWSSDRKAEEEVRLRFLLPNKPFLISPLRRTRGWGIPVVQLAKKRDGLPCAAAEEEEEEAGGRGEGCQCQLARH